MQKDANGERTADEKAMFKRGLEVMASLYASLSGTAVLQQRHVPACPPGQEGVWNGTPYDERGASAPDAWTCSCRPPSSVAAAS